MCLRYCKVVNCAFFIDISKLLLERVKGESDIVIAKQV